jgi:hypothetical protein
MRELAGTVVSPHLKGFGTVEPRIRSETPAI